MQFIQCKYIMLGILTKLEYHGGGNTEQDISVKIALG